MFKALGEVMSSTVVIHAQTASRATPSTTRKLVVSLQAWDNAPVNLIGKAQLPLSFGLSNVVQSISGYHPSDKVPNPATDMVHTLASEVLYTLLFTTMEWSSL